MKSYISIFSRKGLKKKEFLNTSPLLVLPHIYLLNIWINDSFVFLSKKIIFYFQWTFRFRKAPLIGSGKLWKCYISSSYKWQYLYMLVLVDALPNLTLLGQSILPFCTNVRLESIIRLIYHCLSWAWAQTSTHIWRCKCRSQIEHV